MKKLLALCCALMLLLTACAGPAQDGGRDDKLNILCTTYPVYLFTTAVTEGVDGVEVELLVNAQTSCLHDYTLTVNNMKAVERADVIVMNGAGLEEFMTDALSQSDAAVIDCSEDLDLLPALGHEGHGHDAGYDPHVWMDPANAAAMAARVAGRLAELDAANAGRYEENLSAVRAALTEELAPYTRIMAQMPDWELITFHDGFQYFAGAFDLTLLKAIEEEEGAEAAAAEILEIVELVREHGIPAIFTEKNGPTATAKAIVRETRVTYAQLDMIMSGEGSGIRPYIDAIKENLRTIVDAMSGGTIQLTEARLTE